MTTKPIIDVNCHWMPKSFYEYASKKSEIRPHMLERANRIPVMGDLNLRFAIMDRFPGYRQIPSLVSPPLEALAGPDTTSDLSQAANEAMAELAVKHPDRFPGFVAALPMNNPEAAMKEAERAVTSLGAKGVQIFTNVNGSALDRPEYLQIFELMSKLRKPVWLHPARGIQTPDYADETVSKFEIWWALGWPYETGAAMLRLVFAGLFDRCPELAVITHHAGGVIPMMEQRIGSGYELLGSRTPEAMKEAVSTTLKEKPLEAVRRFYADTATFGSRIGIESGLGFFGIDKLMFASDMPFDPEQGPGYIRETLQAISEMRLTDEERDLILFRNACELLNITIQGE